MAWDVLSGATKMAWDVLSGVTKTAWDVLSGVANRCGMFCPGWRKMAWDVLSRDVLSYIPKTPVWLFYSAFDDASRTVLGAWTQMQNSVLMVLRWKSHHEKCPWQG